MLVGCNQKRKGVVNGCFYQALAVTEEETTLLHMDAAEATEPTEPAPPEDDDSDVDMSVSDVTRPPKPP